jgi:hypothetical protein
MGMTDRDSEIAVIRKRKAALFAAMDNGCSGRWLLRQWSQFIRTRDGFRCLCCGTNEGIQAHHVIRKTLFPWSALDPGNGVTLCRLCHSRVHAQFNGRPDMSLPLGAEQGDDQDEWAFLFGLLREDSGRRSLSEDEFYSLGDPVLDFSRRCQGHGDLYEQMARGKMSRLKYVHEVWRLMPEGWYKNYLPKLIALNFLDEDDGADGG